MTYLINKAAAFAAKAHAGVVRKGSGEPYADHTARVAALLAAHGHDAATVAAGHLHDTVEDTDVTYADLVKAFGERVAKLVMMVTNPNAKKVAGVERPSRAIRKEIERAHLARADYAGASIKLADMIDNHTDVAKLAKISPRYAAFIKGYRAEAKLAYPVLAHGDPALHKKLGEILARH